MQGMDVRSLLANQGEPQMSAPTPQSPGGQMTQAQDPAAYGAQVAVAALKKLADDYTQLGDAVLGNQIEAIAVKVNKMHLKRQKDLSDAFNQVQTTALGAM